MRLGQGRARRSAGTQVVVITGSTQGLGFGYAQAFLQRGHHVVISGHTQTSVDDAIDRLEADAVVGAGVAIGQACDVTDPAQVQSLWDFTVRSFGPVGIWLHDADHVGSGAAVASATPAEIERMVQASVDRALDSSKLLVSGLSSQPQGGKLYLTLGCGGAIGRIVPALTVGSATQVGLKRFADSLIVGRRKAGDSRVLIGTLSPGVSVTEGLLREIRALPPEARGKALRRLGFVGDHVATTTSWIVERILAEDRQGHDIAWLTPARLLRRGLGRLFGEERDLLSRYKLDERGGSS
jgi:NAD(P)-dependent dehydrogenase (short-subunit alcohol dehydrogenase family)